MGLKRLVVTASAVVVVVALVSCRNPAAPNTECGAGVFTSLPVPASAILAATPVGNMGPPIHTIPTDHVGIYLNGTGIALSAPGALRVTTVRKTRYVTSPFRAGQSDFAIYATVCRDVTINLGHITTVVSKIENQVGTNCQTYSTVDETVEACLNEHADISFTAGEAIGTVGGVTGGALDLGVYDSTHSNGFVNAFRYSSPTNTAICPYDLFAPTLRSQIDALIGEPGRLASGESPRCGTMAVDVAGTARGVWVLQSDPVNQSGNETNFAVLAPHPLFPQTAQTFSIGLPSLNVSPSSPLVKFPVVTTGRVNRQFRDVTSDGQIYCYVPNAATSTFSLFVQLDAGPILQIQRLNHAAGATPCNLAPATWTLDASAVKFIR